MSIKLKKQSADSVDIPGSTHVQLYVGIDGLPRLKDNNGATTELSQLGVVTLTEQEDSPSSEPDKFKIYAKDVSGVTELFFMDNAGQEIQVTNDGAMAGGGAATALKTTGGDVDVSTLSPLPNAVGQGLIFAGTVEGVNYAYWSYLPAAFLICDAGANFVQILNAAPPTTGQVLTAIDDSSAEWQDPAGGGGGGLTQDPVIRHSNFTAVANTSHYVWIADSVTKTITLPSGVSDGDRVEISGIGNGGSDLFTIDGGGNTVVYQGFAIGSSLPFTFSGAGFHTLFRWSTVNNAWNEIGDSVSVHFGNNPTPNGDSIIFTDSDGHPNTLVVSDNSFVGRINGNGIDNVFYSTQSLSSNFVVPSTSLTDVTGFSFNPQQFFETYCFEFHLSVTQTTTSGIVGLAANRTNVTNFVQNVTLVQANGSSAGFSTHGTNTSPGTSVDDATARPTGGPFEQVITGSFTAQGAGTFTLQAKRSAGTTTINTGSWGRVWRAVAV